MKEEKQKKNQQDLKAVYSKWDRAQKNQEENRKIQHEKTIEKLQKWGERKEKHNSKVKLAELNRVKESKKYTHKFGDDLMRQR